MKGIKETILSLQHFHKSVFLHSEKFYQQIQTKAQPSQDLVIPWGLWGPEKRVWDITPWWETPESSKSTQWRNYRGNYQDNQKDTHPQTLAANQRHREHKSNSLQTKAVRGQWLHARRHRVTRTWLSYKEENTYSGGGGGGTHTFTNPQTCPKEMEGREHNTAQPITWGGEGGWYSRRVAAWI